MSTRPNSTSSGWPVGKRSPGFRALLEVGLAVAIAMAGWVITLQAWRQADDLRWFGDLLVAHDFAQHHVAGHLWREGGATAVYERGAIGRVWVELHGPSRATELFAKSGYLYPPPVAWLSGLLLPEDYRAAVTGYWIFCGVVGVAGVLMAAVLFAPREEPRWRSILWGLSFPSFLTAFLCGQPSAWGLFMVCAGFWAARAARPWLAGLFLAGLAVKPMWFLMMLPMLWAAGFGRVALAAGVFGAVGGLLSLGLFGGWESHGSWLALAVGQEHNRAAWALSGSVPGMVGSWFHQVPDWLPWVLWGVIVGAVTCARDCVFPKSLGCEGRWALAFALAAMGSPYLLHYDLTFLVPLMLAAGGKGGRGWVWWAGALGFAGPVFRMAIGPWMALAGIWRYRAANLSVK